MVGVSTEERHEQAQLVPTDIKFFALGVIVETRDIRATEALATQRIRKEHWNLKTEVLPAAIAVGSPHSRVSLRPS